MRVVYQYRGVKYATVTCSECHEDRRAPLRPGRGRLTCSAKCGRARTRRLARERLIAEQTERVQLLAAATNAAAEELLATLGGEHA